MIGSWRVRLERYSTAADLEVAAPQTEFIGAATEAMEACWLVRLYLADGSSHHLAVFPKTEAAWEIALAANSVVVSTGRSVARLGRRDDPRIIEFESEYFYPVALTWGGVVLVWETGVALLSSSEEELFDWKFDAPDIITGVTEHDDMIVIQLFEAGSVSIGAHDGKPQ